MPPFLFSYLTFHLRFFSELDVKTLKSFSVEIKSRKNGGWVNEVRSNDKECKGTSYDGVYFASLCIGVILCYGFGTN